MLRCYEPQQILCVSIHSAKSATKMGVVFVTGTLVVFRFDANNFKSMLLMSASNMDYKRMT